jgi:DNA modification methylase
MAIKDKVITDTYAIYNGDCIEVMQSLPSQSIHFSIYSPPFCGLYNYSSSEKDLSNCRSYKEFFDHYAFVIEQLTRLTLPGRLSGVHCMDVPLDGANTGGSRDFPGDIIRLHEQCGWIYITRHCIWKEPLAVRNRTMARGLAHRQVVDDSTLCDAASADYLLLFRKKGVNPIPVEHIHGLQDYAGERRMPDQLQKYRNWQGKQTQNRFSHWIWRQYASAFWDDIRLERVLPYKDARDSDDERHQHPLQLDVIERCVVLRTNPGETVLTPFMGVGSEVYGAVINSRNGVGIELKPTYYRQAVKNVQAAEIVGKQRDLMFSV